MNIIAAHQDEAFACTSLEDGAQYIALQVPAGTIIEDGLVAVNTEGAQGAEGDYLVCHVASDGSADLEGLRVVSTSRILRPVLSPVRLIPGLSVQRRGAVLSSSNFPPILTVFLGQ